MSTPFTPAWILLGLFACEVGGDGASDSPPPQDALSTTLPIPLSINTEGFLPWRTRFADISGDKYPDLVVATGGDMVPQYVVTNLWRGQFGISRRAHMPRRAVTAIDTMAVQLNDPPGAHASGVVFGTYLPLHGQADAPLNAYQDPVTGRPALSDLTTDGSGVFGAHYINAKRYLQANQILDGWCVRDMITADMNGDGWKDVVLVGLPIPEGIRTCRRDSLDDASITDSFTAVPLDASSQLDRYRFRHIEEANAPTDAKSTSCQSINKRSFCGRLATNTDLTWELAVFLRDPSSDGLIQLQQGLTGQPLDISCNNNVIPAPAWSVTGSQLSITANGSTCSTLPRPSRLSAADVDGDGWLDLLLGIEQFGIWVIRGGDEAAIDLQLPSGAAFTPSSIPDCQWGSSSHASCLIPLEGGLPYYGMPFDIDVAWTSDGPVLASAIATEVSAVPPATLLTCSLADGCQNRAYFSPSDPYLLATSELVDGGEIGPQIVMGGMASNTNAISLQRTPLHGNATPLSSVGCWSGWGADLFQPVPDVAARLLKATPDATRQLWAGQSGPVIELPILSSVDSPAVALGTPPSDCTELASLPACTASGAEDACVLSVCTATESDAPCLLVYDEGRRLQIARADTTGRPVTVCGGVSPTLSLIATDSRMAMSPSVVSDLSPATGGSTCPPSP